MPLHRAVSEGCSVEYFEIGRGPGKRVARKPCAYHKLPVPLSGVFPGLGVSPGQVFQDAVIQRKIGYHPLELVVFLFQFLQALGLVQLHAAILTPPAVIGIGGDGKFPADFFDRTTLRHLHIDLTEHRNDLFGGEFLARHKSPLFLGPIVGSVTHDLDQVEGGRSVHEVTKGLRAGPFGHEDLLGVGRLALDTFHGAPLRFRDSDHPSTYSFPPNMKQRSAQFYTFPKRERLLVQDYPLSLRLLGVI